MAKVEITETLSEEARYLPPPVMRLKFKMDIQGGTESSTLRAPETRAAMVMIKNRMNTVLSRSGLMSFSVDTTGGVARIELVLHMISMDQHLEDCQRAYAEGVAYGVLRSRR